MNVININTYKNYLIKTCFISSEDFDIIYNNLHIKRITQPNEFAYQSALSMLKFFDKYNFSILTLDLNETGGYMMFVDRYFICCSNIDISILNFLDQSIYFKTNDCKMIERFFKTRLLS